MTTTISALATLSRRVARSFHRLLARPIRKATLAVTVTVAVPPFIKVAVTYKADLGKAANDNRPQRGPRSIA